MTVSPPGYTWIELAIIIYHPLVCTNARGMRIVTLSDTINAKMVNWGLYLRQAITRVKSVFLIPPFYKHIRSHFSGKPPCFLMVLICCCWYFLLMHIWLVFLQCPFPRNWVISATTISTTPLLFFFSAQSLWSHLRYLCELPVGFLQ